MTSGLWKYSRPPNYFGEASMWWGIWLISLSVVPELWYLTIISPLLITFLLAIVISLLFFMKGFLNEFKAFAMRGNVIDLAIGVIIGGAFSSIVNSLVGDIIMPIIGAVTGGIDFSGLSVRIGSATIAYGKFIQAAFVFGIVAFALFLVVKALNAMKKKEEAKPASSAELPADIRLLTEIRDILKK